MTGKLLQEPNWRAMDSGGLAVAGAKLYAYATGTTTPQNTYTTSALSVANANPVVADSGGLFPPVYLDPSLTYRFILKTSGGSTLDDVDPVTAAANIAAGGVSASMLAVGAAASNLGYTPANSTTSLQTGRHVMVVKADAMIPRTTNGPAAGSTETGTNKVMVTGYDFDQTTSEGVQIMFPVPKSVTVTSYTARFRWTALSSSGNVIWGTRAVGCGDGDALDAAFGTGVTVTDTLLSTSQQHTSPETSTVTVAGSPASQDMLLIEVYRDAANGSDTLAADARLLAVELFLTVSATTDT